MQINDLIDRVESLEGGEALARDLRKFVNKRKLGLVYEESKPEYVRLVGKPVVEEDLVNILPPRGTMENMSGDDDADVIWFVESIDDDKAHLVALEGDESCDVAYDDLVAVARFDQTIYCGLTETGRVERGGDRPFHAVINGENYHALELLLFPYFQSVDCIYIDPPYNKEDSKDWKYNCNYVDGNDAYRHSKWLTMHIPTPCLWARWRCFIRKPPIGSSDWSSYQCSMTVSPDGALAAARESIASR